MNLCRARQNFIPRRLRAHRPPALTDTPPMEDLKNMNHNRKLLFATLTVTALAGTSQAEFLYGLTNFQELVTFDSVTRAVTSTTPLAGFSIGGEILVGIDVRPATGELYGISSANNLYRINTITGASTQVGATIAPAPAGSIRAIDFNPTVDRIRFVSSGGTNLRLHPDTGAIAFTDTNLAFAAGDPNAGDAPSIVNIAYTNSFAGATTTTLFNIDAFNDILTSQNPPNNGTLNTIGPVGFDIASSGGFTGFDISGQTGIAYLAGNNLTGGLTANSLYAVNLATGQASLLGAVSGINGSFRDIAVVPAPFTAGLFGLTLLAGTRRRRHTPADIMD